MENIKNWKVFKRILCTMMAVAMAFSLSCTPAFAADLESPVTDVPVARQSIGSVLTSCAGTCSGGYTEITCVLGSGNFWADIVAGVSSSDADGIVYCSAVDPDGTSYDLGTVPASGGQTSYVEASYLKAGTYKFRFEANTSASIEVYGRIHD